MVARPWLQIAWLRWFLIFWRIVLWASLLIGCYDVQQADPMLLRGWRGGWLFALIVIFLSVYELYERTEYRRGYAWPAPYWLVLAYLAVQLLVVLALLQYSLGFIGPVFALMGQVFSSLPTRRWLVPIALLTAVAGVPFDVYEALYALDWGKLVGFTFFIGNWVAIAIFVGLLFRERSGHERLIAELRLAKEEIERYAHQAGELAALRERERLAREMHDSLGHALVLVNVQLEAAQRLYAVEPARGAAQLEDTRTLVRQSMVDLRHSLANLRAALPSQQPFPAVLQQIAAEARERTGLEIVCTLPSEVVSLPAATSEALWRVAREALANIERHAAARHAWVLLEPSNEGMVLRISDDGSGIAIKAMEQPGHYGIAGMRERLTVVGGTLHITNRVGGGTVVEARVPLA